MVEPFRPPSVAEGLERLIAWSRDVERVLRKEAGGPFQAVEAGIDALRAVRRQARALLPHAVAGDRAVHELMLQARRIGDQVARLGVARAVPVAGEGGLPRPVPIGGHTLPPLPYPYDALEPYIDEETMRIHHDRLHRGYVEALNEAERELARARQSGQFALVKYWEGQLAFNGAGHYLHTLFWAGMSPQGGGPATGSISREIARTFGSFDEFRDQFSAAAEKVEGPGWALLVWSPRAHRVEILQAEKHQNLSQQDQIPLLALDVWEHAYFLKYQNRRRDYIEAWWHVVNWDEVNRRFAQARRVLWPPY